MTTNIFYDMAAQQSWSESTQIDVLLEYIENQKSDEAFLDFLHEKASFESQNAIATPLGLEDALAKLMDDDELCLYQCEIGLFDISNDPNTPFETHAVAVASESKEQATEDAQILAENSIPVVKDIAFAPTDIATEIDAGDYEINQQ